MVATPRPAAALLLLSALCNSPWLHRATASAMASAPVRSKVKQGAKVLATVQDGMIIDAGSSGSRMHVYHWEKRVFSQLPLPLSYPETHG